MKSDFLGTLFLAEKMTELFKKPRTFFQDNFWKHCFMHRKNGLKIFRCSPFTRACVCRYFAGVRASPMRGKNPMRNRWNNIPVALPERARSKSPFIPHIWRERRAALRKPIPKLKPILYTTLLLKRRSTAVTSPGLRVKFSWAQSHECPLKYIFTCWYPAAYYRLHFKQFSTGKNTLNYCKYPSSSTKGTSVSISLLRNLLRRPSASTTKCVCLWGPWFVCYFCFNSIIHIQSKSFNSVGRNISALVGCIKKLRALYEVQLLEIYKIPQLNLI